MDLFSALQWTDPTLNTPLDPSTHTHTPYILYTGRIQCEVLTTLPFCFSRIKKFLGQQSKI